MRTKKNIFNLCQIDDCERPVHVKKHQLCKTHAWRLYTGRDVNAPLPMKKQHEPYKPKKDKK